jgi:hypothetical protein
MQCRAEKGEVPCQVSMDLLLVSGDQAKMMSIPSEEDGAFIVQAFDALGNEHGRSDAGFRWALDIPGAIDGTTVTDLKGVSAMHGKHCRPLPMSRIITCPLMLIWILCRDCRGPEGAIQHTLAIPDPPPPERIKYWRRDRMV